ncbi:putative protein [Vanrija pseudolonga]|uniref:Purtative protein n=1 Tax=Vanrija pseudolonga TaxID=143232 RepID=A0AAF0Y438_9TREE|nr:purtative protein [Vanrija pseudolonga]
MSTDHLQDEIHRESLADPERFWRHQAEQLHWHKFPSQMLKTFTKTLPSGVEHKSWEWFPDGELSYCYNAVDRHVAAGRGNQPAIYYDSPVTRNKRTITYSELLDEVETLAGVLREEGVEKGDVVLIYMPQVPAAAIGILASNRLGAAHCVVFGGFSAPALAQRIDAVRPKVILTATCGIDGTKPPIPYRPFVHEAIRLATHKPRRTIIWQRSQVDWPADESKGERNWQALVKFVRDRGVRTECVPVASTAPCYISHTSGTTGNPKGVIRDTGGHAVGLHLSVAMVFNIRGPGSVIFAASDIGWVLGHAFILSAPLLTGAATIIYEGKPVGTPNAGAFWRIVEEYKVNTLYCAPTALRAMKREDPDYKYLKEIGERGGLKSLRALFLAGERSEPSIITSYQELLDAYAAPDAHVIDNWWSTETGSPITSRALIPQAGKDRQTKEVSYPPPELRPGSAGKPMPGFDLRIVDDDGNEVPRGTMGNIVLALPLAPTSFNTLWEDEQRFYKGYLERFNGKYLDTGDAGYQDKDGYVSIMARNDDVLNVSAHRLSGAAIEQSIASHPLVAEACVVGVPDALKGQLPFAFVTLSVADHPTSAVPDPKLLGEIQQLVRSQVGAIATLGGVIQGVGMIPKTRSGKTLRRVLRSLLENAADGDFDAKVDVPSTVEDIGAVEAARQKIREYMAIKGASHKAIEARHKL